MCSDWTENIKRRHFPNQRNLFLIKRQEWTLPETPNKLHFGLILVWHHNSLFFRFCFKYIRALKLQVLCCIYGLLWPITDAKRTFPDKTEKLLCNWCLPSQKSLLLFVLPPVEPLMHRFYLTFDQKLWLGDKITIIYSLIWTPEYYRDLKMGSVHMTPA